MRQSSPRLEYNRCKLVNRHSRNGENKAQTACGVRSAKKLLRCYRCAGLFVEVDRCGCIGDCEDTMSPPLETESDSGGDSAAIELQDPKRSLGSDYAAENQETAV